MDKKLFDYVKKYFQSKFPEKCVLMENEEINNIVIEVCKELKTYDRSQVLDSKVDDVIFELINGFAKKNRGKLWTDTINLENYVSDYVSNHNLSRCSEGITNYIIKQIVVKLIPHYNVSKLNKGFFDNNIELLFNEYRVKLYKEINNLVSKKVSNVDVITPGFKNDEVAVELTKYFMVCGSYDVLDDLRGKKYDGYIYSYINEIVREIEKNRRENSISKQSVIKPNPVEYISNYIIDNLDVERKLSRDEIIDCAIYINGGLSIPNKNRDRGLTSDEIVSHKYDTEIVRYYNRYLMKKNSTKNKNVPKKVKQKKKKRWMQRNISALLVTVTLLGVAGTAGVYAAGKLVDAFADDVVSVITDVTDMKYDNAVDEFDGFKYTYIFYNGTNAVKPTALNALDFHSKIQEAGYNNENYDYLGFYRAYQNVREDRLYIMDTMLDIVQKEAVKREPGSSFCKSISEDSCYLEFAINRLVEMGCEEIKEQKYINALFAYLEAKSNHPSEAPMEYMDPEDVKVVEEIMEKYQKYSEQVMLEFGTIRHNESEVVANLSEHSGRGL